jgi:SulP family sulfate permease
MKYEFEPKLITVLKKGYPSGQFIPDLTAGVLTGIVALPLAIAFAIASGVKPEQGLYTAIIAGGIISLLSGSRVQIGGPTGAFIVVVFAIVQKFGINGLAVATIMAGIMLVIMGLLKLGNAIKYIPYPVTVGFTSGIALIIAITQIKDFFGLQIEDMPAELTGKLQSLAANFNTVSWPALGVGAASIVIMLTCRKISPRIPGALIAILLSTVVSAVFALPLDTINSRFGSVPSSLPMPSLPGINMELVITMFPSAITIALLAGIESLLSAVVADGMTGFKHRSNAELIAQGAANIICPLFGGIPATGAIARTATNIKNGGRTPLAGIIHAVTLLLILIFFGKWAGLIPMASLSAVLLVVAYNMSEWKLFVRMFKSPKSDSAIMLITFLLTVLVDLTVAIQVGVVLAALLFMHRMESVSDAKLVNYSDPDQEEEEDDDHNIKNYTIPDGVEIFEINGPFFFGAAAKFKDSVNFIEKKPLVLVLRMRHVNAIDATGIRALEDIASSMKKIHTTLLISGLKKQPAKVLKRSGTLELVGHGNIHKNIGTALFHAAKIIGPTVKS